MSRKPFLSLVAASAASLLAIVGFTACGNGTSNDATVVEAAATPQFLTESADRTSAVESGRFELSVDVPASKDVPSGFTIKGSGAFDLANKRSDTTIDLSGLIAAAKDTQDTGMLDLFGDGKFEIITDNDVVYLHAGFLSALLGGDSTKPWVKLPADKSTTVTNDLSGGLADATALLDLLRDNGATVTDLGQADVQGQSTHHFQATISVADALAAAPEASREKAHAFIDQLGAAASNVKLPIDVYVDDQGLVRRMQMTFDGDVFKQLADADPAAAAGQGPVTFTLDFLDLGESVEIQLPPTDQVGDAKDLANMFQNAPSDAPSDSSGS